MKSFIVLFTKCLVQMRNGRKQNKILQEAHRVEGFVIITIGLDCGIIWRVRILVDLVSKVMVEKNYVTLNDSQKVVIVLFIN